MIPVKIPTAGDWIRVTSDGKNAAVVVCERIDWSSDGTEWRMFWSTCNFEVWDRIEGYIHRDEPGTLYWPVTLGILEAAQAMAVEKRYAISHYNLAVSEALK
ncbi:hypothetical protein EBT16_01005 [bacterium]|nr:hypothetical protein [bacterium]